MSGRKNVLPPNQVLNASVSSTTSYTSSTTDISYIDNISYVPLVATGTPSGTFVVKVSHDKLNWQPLTLSAVPTATSGVLTNVPIALNQVPFPYVQLVYTNSSGTGTVTATVFGKML